MRMHNFIFTTVLFLAAHSSLRACENNTAVSKKSVKQIPAKVVARLASQALQASAVKKEAVTIDFMIGSSLFRF